MHPVTAKVAGSEHERQLDRGYPKHDASAPLMILPPPLQKTFAIWDVPETPMGGRQTSRTIPQPTDQPTKEITQTQFLRTGDDSSVFGTAEGPPQVSLIVRRPCCPLTRKSHHASIFAPPHKYNTMGTTRHAQRNKICHTGQAG